MVFFLPGRKREAVHIRLAAILRGNVFFPSARLLGNRVFISNIMHSGGDIITDKYGGWGDGFFKLCDDPAIIDWSTEIPRVYFYKNTKNSFYFSSIELVDKSCLS